MNRKQARHAIRLGMSEKKPTEDVGFRGIGVYSGFNMCNQLEIVTKSAGAEPSKIVFDFGRIREILSEEKAVDSTANRPHLTSRSYSQTP